MAITGDFENVEHVQAELYVKIKGEFRPATHNDLEKFGFVPAGSQSEPASNPEPADEPAAPEQSKDTPEDPLAGISSEQAEGLQDLFARLSSKARESNNKSEQERPRPASEDTDGPNFDSLFDALRGDGEFPIDFIFGFLQGGPEAFDLNGLKDIFDSLGSAGPDNKNDSDRGDKTPPTNLLDGMGNGGFSGNGLNGLPPELLIMLMKLLGNGGFGGLGGQR